MKLRSNFFNRLFFVHIQLSIHCSCMKDFVQKGRNGTRDLTFYVTYLIIGENKETKVKFKAYLNLYWLFVVISLVEKEGFFGQWTRLGQDISWI